MGFRAENIHLLNGSQVTAVHLQPSLRKGLRREVSILGYGERLQLLSLFMMITTNLIRYKQKSYLNCIEYRCVKYLYICVVSQTTKAQRVNTVST